MNIENIIIPIASAFEQAIEKLNSGGQGFLAVVDDKNKLIGILTDGDIRRAFLNKQTELSQIVNKNPLTASNGISENQAALLLKKNHKRHLPIVDENGVLVNVFLLDDWKELIKPNTIIIMAGGMGKRLGELTKSQPKPLLPVAGKPILEKLILLFVQHGYYNFLISVNYKGELIKNYFKDGSNWGINISYIEEESPLGTAGALSLITHELNSPFLVINGDILTAVPFPELFSFHLQNNSFATMCVLKKEYQINFGTVEFSQDYSMEKILEKPKMEYHINAGIYVFQPEALKYIEKNKPMDMPDFFLKLKNNSKKTIVYPIEDYWIDIGIGEDYLKANQDFS